MRQIFQSLTLLFALTSVESCYAQASATTASTSKSEPVLEPQHNRKIWTNEDLIGLRKPADIYLEQENARKDAELHPVAETAINVQQTLLPIETPKSIEEADRFIEEKKNEIVTLVITIQTVKEKLAHPDADETEHLKSAMKQLTADLGTASDELKLLQLAREKLNATPSN
jgi:hypothetical protein